MGDRTVKQFIPITKEDAFKDNLDENGEPLYDGESGMDKDGNHFVVHTQQSNVMFVPIVFALFLVICCFEMVFCGLLSGFGCYFFGRSVQNGTKKVQFNEQECESECIV